MNRSIFNLFRCSCSALYDLSFMQTDVEIWEEWKSFRPRQYANMPAAKAIIVSGECETKRSISFNLPRVWSTYEKNKAMQLHSSRGNSEAIA